MAISTRASCPHCPGSSKLYIVPHGLRVHIGRKHKDVFPLNSVNPAVSPAVTSAGSGCLSGTNAGLHDLLSLKARVRVLRHVPKGARCLAAGKLASLIEQCVKSNCVADWLALLSFAYMALKVPDQRDKKSLTAKVKANIESSLPSLSAENSPHRSPSLYKSVQAKVFEGDLRGAARLLTSECSFAPSGAETLTALREKHPFSSFPLYVPPAPNESTPCLVVSAEKVSGALRSFYRGSAGGMDGLRPEHLKELTSSSAGDNGQRLLVSITRLCNFLLEGKLNSEVCPFLYGGSLCALKKKDGGIRPIAAGNTFRRLVAKLCCQEVRSNITPYLQPHQVGFGTSLGCEAAIHATRTFVMREGANDILLKLDIRNAFNSIDRGAILSEVKELTPSIFPFLYQCYSAPSYLSFEGDCVLSQVGAQQGDPLGPLIFSVAIHKAIKSLESPLNIWYLDDGTLGGNPDTVARDVRSLLPALRELGLEVNTTKCEFYPCSQAAAESRAIFTSLIPGIRVMDRKSLTLLGAPIFPEGVQDSLASKTQTLTLLAGHLRHLPAHVALTLLRTCFAMPRLTYVIRTSPTWQVPEGVECFDGILKQILEETLNVSLSDAQWCQASLPIRFGGLGVRRLQESGPIAFLASSYGVMDLVTAMLPVSGDSVCIPYAAEAQEVWSLRYPGADLPAKPGLQRGWDDIAGSIILSQLRGTATGVELARLNAASRPESGAWLHALPSPHVGTLLDNDSLRVAAGLRLGCAICEPHICVCGATVEANGYHGLSCTRCAGRRPRHHAINEVIRRALVKADIPCALEPPGLSRSDGKRPDGLTLIPWQRGRCLIWDATCVSTYASCHLHATQRVASSGAETAAKGKHLKYATLESAYEFVPFAVETAGPWASEAKKFVAELGRRLRDRGHDPLSGLYLTQHISLAIQRGNAASLMGTFGRVGAERE